MIVVMFLWFITSILKRRTLLKEATFKCITIKILELYICKPEIEFYIADHF